jgi:hypothetical protein
MLLPIHAALGTRTALGEFTVTPRAVEFRSLVAALCGFVVAVWAAEFGTVIPSAFESRTVAARTIEFRAIATILARPLKLRPVAKLPFTSFAILARTREARTFVAATAVIALLPRFFVAAITPPELALAVAIPSAALAVPGAALAVPRAALAVPELAILETAGGARLVAIAAGSPIIAVAARRTVAARLERALLAIAIACGPIAERPIATRTVVTAEPRPVATSLAIEFFRAEAALGELLVRPARFTGAALATIGTVTPAPGIIVSVVVAGHERARSRDQMAMGAPQAAPNSRKTGLDFC